MTTCVHEWVGETTSAICSKCEMDRYGHSRAIELEAELAAERARCDALMAAVVGSNGTNEAIRAINAALDACNRARPCVSPSPPERQPK